jgi:hypothetical protein
MIADDLQERNAHRNHIEAVADDSGCFARFRDESLYLVNGLFDLYYFSNPDSAARFATRFGGSVLETSQGSIWRVSICVYKPPRSVHARYAHYRSGEEMSRERFLDRE